MYLKFGLPTVRPFSAALASIKDWMQRAGTATDFHYLILSALFATAPRPIALVRALTLRQCRSAVVQD